MDDEKSLETLEAELRADESQDDAGQDLGIESAPEATDTDTPDPGTPKEDSAALAAELERLRKEKQNLELERNLLRNKEKAAEKARLESVNKDELEEVRSAYETLLAEKQARDAAEEEEAERTQANEFRNNLISQRPEAVQKAARALIEKNETNLAWSNARDEADAAAQLNAQLDALQEVLGVQAPAAPAPEKPVIHGNNPAPNARDRRFEELSLEEMEKELGWAESR